MQVSDFRCVRPFGLRGKWPPDHQHVSSSLSKIPYSGFSPVRLQTGIQPGPSSTMLRLSVRPAYTQTSWIYTRLKSLSPKRALFRRRTYVQAGLPLSYRDIPVQRSLAPQRVMLSRRITAYYDLIRASLLLPPVYVLSSGSLPVGLLRAGDEKVPNLSCLSFPIVPSSVPRRLSDCNRLLLHRSLWPSPSLHKVGVRVSTLAGPMRGLRNEAATVRFMLRPDGIASPTPARAFTFELSPPGSPLGDVEYNYAGKQPIPAAGLTPARQAAV